MNECKKLDDIKGEIYKVRRLLCASEVGSEREQELLRKLDKLAKEHEEEYQKEYGNYEEWKTMQKYI